MAGAALHQLASNDNLGLQPVSSFQTDPQMVVYPPAAPPYEQRRRAYTTSALAMR